MNLHVDNLIKRKRRIYENYCVICDKSLNKENSKNPIVRNVTKEGLKLILNTADIRKDKVYDLLWPVKDDMLSLKQKGLFHRNCRVNCISKHSIESIKRNQEIFLNSEKESQESSLASGRLRRASTSSFNIHAQCFICGKGYSPPQSRSFVHLLPLLPESRTSERLCQIRDVS